ncbi:MAG: phosphate ABC transporter permease subunit PstC [Proteobacteria bacterium]|nr:phosphate ABC transporter permease subunit PstC [Pseudomonadota bacterium]
MSDLNLFSVLILSALIVFFLSQKKAKNWQTSAGSERVHSLPVYYGYFGSIWTVIPALFVFAFWSFFSTNVISTMVVGQFVELQALDKSSLSLALNEIYLMSDASIVPSLSDNTIKAQAANLFMQYSQYSAIFKSITVLAIAALGFILTYWRITPTTKARNSVENIVVYALLSCAVIAILTTAGIIFSVLLESIEFFKTIPVSDFLFGTHWSPQIALREDQAGSSGAFGAVPLFWGTIFISLIAIIIAGPLGLISAIYLSEYASKRVRSIVKPVLEILAGVPTVVYGFFAALTIGPLVRDFGYWLREMGVNLDIQILANLTVSTESALAAGLVMGMMIVPFILSLSDDVIAAVPDSMRDGSTAMGATKSETVWKVIIPAALPGIVGGFLLAISRAIGETMIVLMAAGVASNLTANPMNSVTTVTTQIVTLLTGDQEFDSVKTLAAFALGLGLFITTLVLNIIALHVVRRYREQYE